MEFRLNDTKRQQIRVGDLIEFLNLSDKTLKVRVCVVALHHFSSFEDLFRVLPLAACGYGPGERVDPRSMERYYSKEEQARWGVVGSWGLMKNRGILSVRIDAASDPIKVTQFR